MWHASSVPYSMMQLLHTSTPTRCRSLPILRVQPCSKAAAMCHTQQGSKSADDKMVEHMLELHLLVLGQQAACSNADDISAITEIPGPK
jgi:hypothetical protein